MLLILYFYLRKTTY